MAVDLAKIIENRVKDIGLADAQKFASGLVEVIDVFNQSVLAHGTLFGVKLTGIVNFQIDMPETSAIKKSRRIGNGRIKSLNGKNGR